MAPNDPSADDVQANADLLRRLAANIGLAGPALVAVCQRIALDIGAERVSDAAPRRTQSPPEAMVEG